MMGVTSLLEKSVYCTAAIATAYTIAKFGADDHTLSVAAAATDNLVGIFQHTTSAANDEVRVALSGISWLKLGGTVTRGDRLTADASAYGITATQGQSVVAVALASGVSGDLIPVFVMPQVWAPNQGADGLTLCGIARATYDFSVDGGAVGAIALGVTIPDNAIISRAWGDVITGCTSAGGAGTIALTANSAGDLLAAVDADTKSGIFALIPVGTAATMIKLTAARELTLTIGTEALTAGKIVFFCEYVLSV